MPGLPGIMFRAGDGLQVTDVVDALAADVPFVAGSLQAQYAGDSSIPRVLVTDYVAIPLQRAVPNIVLLGKGLTMLRFAGVGFEGRERLPLEGDFDKTFTLYCPAGYERDALEIFTPNLMQLLMDTTGGCDVELVDDWMFVYSRPGFRRDGSTLARIAEATGFVRSTVERQTSRYVDDRAPKIGATVSPEEFEARRGGVAAGGRRVKTKSTPLQKLVLIGSWVVFLAIAGYAVYEWLLPRL